MTLKQVQLRDIRILLNEHRRASVCPLKGSCIFPVTEGFLKGSVSVALCGSPDSMAVILVERKIHLASSLPHL